MSLNFCCEFSELCEICEFFEIYEFCEIHEICEFHNHCSGTGCTICRPTVRKKLHCVLVVLNIIIIIIIIIIITIISFVVLLNCLYPKLQVLLFIHSPPHPTGEGESK